MWLENECHSFPVKCSKWMDSKSCWWCPVKGTPRDEKWKDEQYFEKQKGIKLRLYIYCKLQGLRSLNFSTFCRNRPLPHVSCCFLNKYSWWELAVGARFTCLNVYVYYHLGCCRHLAKPPVALLVRCKSCQCSFFSISGWLGHTKVSKILTSRHFNWISNSSWLFYFIDVLYLSVCIRFLTVLQICSNLKLWLLSVLKLWLIRRLIDYFMLQWGKKLAYLVFVWLVPPAADPWQDG